MKCGHFKFQFNFFGALSGVLGLAFLLAAAWEFFGFRSHGVGHFYEFAPVGALLLLSGLGACIHRRKN